MSQATDPSLSSEPSGDTPASAEDQQAAVDKAFRSLLEGLRTTLPGVEVLLAFLLILPLQQGFQDTSTLQRGAYLLAVVTSALAAVLLIAPSAHQRVRATRTSDREGAGVPRRHEQHLRTTVTITMAGTILAAVAMTTAVGLAGSFVLGPFGLALGAVVGATLAWAWFYVPTVVFD